jgi:hypothetical protein
MESTVLAAAKMRVLVQGLQKKRTMESVLCLASTGAERRKAMAWVKVVKMKFLDGWPKSFVWHLASVNAEKEKGVNPHQRKITKERACLRRIQNASPNVIFIPSRRLYSIPLRRYSVTTANQRFKVNDTDKCGIFDRSIQCSCRTILQTLGVTEKLNMFLFYTLSELVNDYHEPLKLVETENCLWEQPKVKSAETKSSQSGTGLRGPMDIAQSWGRTRVATASRSTLKPMASCTDNVAICQPD